MPKLYLFAHEMGHVLYGSGGTEGKAFCTTQPPCFKTISVDRQNANCDCTLADGTVIPSSMVSRIPFFADSSLEYNGVQLGSVAGNIYRHSERSAILGSAGDIACLGEPPQTCLPHFNQIFNREQELMRWALLCARFPDFCYGFLRIDSACRPPVCRQKPRVPLLDRWCPTIVANGKREWIIVDVLMVYTRNAMCGEVLGDSSTVEERKACPITDDNKERIEKIAREMVHETNEAFCNSNMEIFLNIVGFELWDTTLEDEETPSQPSYLGAADNTTYRSPEIDCMRKKYQADVVAVIIDRDLVIAENGNNGVWGDFEYGVPNCETKENWHLSYIIVNRQSQTSTMPKLYTFAHEMGHVLSGTGVVLSGTGVTEDVAFCTTQPPCFKTISMDRQDAKCACTLADGTVIPSSMVSRIPFFADSSLEYNGVQLGNLGSDDSERSLILGSAGDIACLGQVPETCPLHRPDFLNPIFDREQLMRLALICATFPDFCYGPNPILRPRPGPFPSLLGMSLLVGLGFFVFKKYRRTREYVNDEEETSGATGFEMMTT